MKKSKILFTLLLTSAALVSCGANKTEISLLRRKKLLPKIAKKKSPTQALLLQQNTQNLI